jgi:hypothetical protein
MSDNLTSDYEDESLDPEWVKAVSEKVTIARAEIASGEALDGETIVNQLLEGFRIAKESELSTIDEEDSKESILSDLTEAMRSTRAGEVFPIEQLWEQVYE